jgi:hypothetical protein
MIQIKNLDFKGDKMNRAEVPITAELLRALGLNVLSFVDIFGRLGLPQAGLKLIEKEAVVYDSAKDIYYFQVEGKNIPDGCSRLVPEYLKNKTGNGWSLIRVRYYGKDENLMQLSGFGPDQIKLSRLK